MTEKELKCANIISAINEIDEVLNAIYFDRKKAEDIICKHNKSDMVIGTYNSPLNPNSFPFEMLSDEAIRSNLCKIRDYLVIKLAKEQFNG